MELTLTIRGPRGLGAQLYQELRKAIFDGRLTVGEQLPSSRDLARQLSLSRNTVNNAYERLVSEGYLCTRHGAGTFVAQHVGERDRRPLALAPATATRITQWARRLDYAHSIVPLRNLPHDFRPGLPDLPHFPIDTWRRLAARTLKTLSHEVAHYGDPAGHPALRAAIARYVAYSRAVPCDGDDVLVTNGSQQALDLLGRILVEPGTTVAVEDPGYPAAISVFRAMGARIVPVPVDGEGLQVDRVPTEAQVVYVTPSHQFPLGVTLSLARRTALLDWAVRRGAVIIEDDYDSEFRFGGRPLESLHGLDHAGVVVYLGTFSKVLFPGLRLGYVVTPASLKEPLVAAKWITDRHTPALEQCVMAAFLAEGHFDKYMRRMQRVYAQRQDTLLSALARWTAPWIEVLPSHAGLHVTGLLPDGFDVDELIDRAFETGVGLYSIGPFYQGRPRAGLMFGYGACTLTDISEGVRRLRGVLQSCTHA